MKRFIKCVTCLVLFHGTISGLGQIAVDEQIAQRKMIPEQVEPLLGVINNKTISIDQILPNIQRVEDISQDHSILYLDFMERITGRLRNHESKEEATRISRDIIAKAAFLPLEMESFNMEECTEALSIQLNMLLSFFPAKTEEIIDCDPMLRQKYADRLLEIYQLIVSQIEENYDPNTEDSIPNFKGFVPPASYRGLAVFGMDYSNVEDAATRIAYNKYMEEQWAKSHKRWAFNRIEFVRNHSKKAVEWYLVGVYSLFPYRSSELEQMLEDRQFDSELSKTILEAVRKAEQEFPDKEFRVWMSKDGLHKITAKFVSLEETKVTLERADGISTTIEFFALCEFDQEYICRRLEIEELVAETKPLLFADFRNWESTYRPLEAVARAVLEAPDEGHITETIIVIPKSEIWVHREPQPLPEAPNRWSAIIIGNLIFIALYLLLWWTFRKRKS